MGLQPELGLAAESACRSGAYLYLLDGKAIPDNRHDVSIRFMDFVRDNPHLQIFEDELFTIRYFQKGSGHITFKRLDLVEKMNDIVAKHFPSALSAK